MHVVRRSHHLRLFIGMLRNILEVLRRARRGNDQTSACIGSLDPLVECGVFRVGGGKVLLIVHLRSVFNSLFCL